MRLVSEQTRGEVRARTLACDECGGDCESRFVAFQARHDQLWVCLLWQESDERAADELRIVLDDGVEDLPSIVELYLALTGLTWPVLLSRGQTCMDQLLICHGMPDWMLRVPVDTLWATRGCVFGNDLTRVQRALWAAHRYYVPDAPALEPWGR